jgi:hypothetical protein
VNRGGVAALLLTLCACGKERPDPRIGELTSPIHITVRVIDAPMEKDCQGTTWEKLKCTFSRADRQGCTYVEVGVAADHPELSKSVDVRRCHMMDGSARTVLTNEPGKKATITLDAAKRRAVIELSDAAHVIYLRDGEVVAQRKLWETGMPGPGGIGFPAGVVDWSRVPPFLSVIDNQLLLKVPEEELDFLIAESPTGKADLKMALITLASTADLAGEGWARAVSKLDETGKQELREALVTAVSNGAFGALEWFEAHPEEKKADFLEALVEAAEQETFDLGDVLPKLLVLVPARAETIACEHLERRWHEYSGGYEYDYYPPSSSALAVLITRKAKCPWVLPLLLRTPCGTELRCDPDVDDLKPTPLCDDEQIDAALRRTLGTDLELSIEELDLQDSDWGPLLVAAARLQGPLPPDFVRSDERRLYKQLYTFKGAEEDDACRQLSTGPVEWACRLPMSITTANYENCTIVLDDQKKTMTLSAPPIEEDE